MQIIAQANDILLIEIEPLKVARLANLTDQVVSQPMPMLLAFSRTRWENPTTKLTMDDIRQFRGW